MRSYVGNRTSDLHDAVSGQRLRFDTSFEASRRDIFQVIVPGYLDQRELEQHEVSIYHAESSQTLRIFAESDHR
jgi:hypothetical protein